MSSPAPPSPSARVPATTWPLVLGILGLVVGIGGALMNGCLGNFGMAVVCVMGDFFEKLAASRPQMQMNAAQMEALRGWAPAMFTILTVNAAIAVVLIVAATKLLRRRPGAGRVWLTWAVLRLLATVPSSIVSFLMNRDQFEALEGAAVSAPNPMTGFLKFNLAEGFGWIGMVIGLVIGWALPIFTIVWFLRRPIRREIATWVQPPPTKADPGG